ncbi:unnamed protein product [Rotaria magnacalcarata]|uniref:RBR-type E3 ubiquitin transferase n=1 Tax=Rotaria magnacalcarata TaxID=392030 RepID=A0A816TEY9_9BILA|nr:unnamed protein product [Rotaria magnacalcarata]CAF2100157.1 unnamed protein product [Rotaria magnacalcarata]
MDEELRLCDEHIFRCSICCNDIEERTVIFQIESCHCQFCTECVRQYCISQISIPLALIKCPNTECHSSLSSNEIRILLTDSQFQLYKKRLFEHEVTNDPRLLFCPQVNCDHVLILPEEQINSTEQAITCTQCQTTFCLKCRCQWHPNQPCSDSLTSDEMNAESNIKRCVRCRFPLERTDGCAQMTCINCKHMFCWYCLKSLDNDFFLLHYERGPCRNRLGHSRASLFLHRLLVVGLFIVLTILVILASPLLMLMAPCLICYRYKQLKNYFNNSTMWRRTVQEENASTIEQQPIISLLPSWNLDTCNISTV